MKKLSICAIVGNESVHIERFLKSFAPIADEFVIVRAIGSAKPDDTMSKIGGIGVPIRIGEYYNAPDERAAWPHVDDFGAARQESFDLATGDWLAWFDCDDLWPDNSPENDNLIRQMKSGELESFARVHMNYLVPDSGAMIARERFARRKAHPKWVNPIHEAMHVLGKPAYFENAQILHAPLNDKKGAAQRNLRILEFATAHPELYEDQSSLWFYKHRELMYLGKAEESMTAAHKALELLRPIVESDGDPQDSHTILLYEILIITAGISLDKGDASDARARAHGAINVMPGRREAYALLAQIEHSKKNFRKMLAYAGAMRGIDEPKGIDRTWTQRDMLYSWQGAFLFHHALRLNGQVERAEAEEKNIFHLEGAAISIIHPTMLRNNFAVETHEKWMAKAFNPGQVEYIFAVDPEDGVTIDTLKPYKTVLCPRGSRAAAEYAKRFATGKRVEVIGDNWESPLWWDQDFDKVVKPQLPWKLEAPYEGYPNIILKKGPRFVICSKWGKSPFPDFEPQHCNFELGWEQGTSHIQAKWLLSQRKLDPEYDTIVTLPGREFLYQSCFPRVITWEKYCSMTGKEYGKPYRDVSAVDTLDFVEYFERNWHRYDDIYFTGPNTTWNGGAWDLIQSFQRPTIIPTAYDFNGEKMRGGGFLLMSLRKRPHESRRDTPDEFGRDVLRAVRDALGLPIFLVGLNLPDFGVEGVRPCNLQEFATLMQFPECIGILGPHSGPNGLAGLLAPKGKNIILFPMEWCPSIDSNYPSGMGKCLNLNGNVRHWLPVQSKPSEIAKKAREILG